MIHLPIILDDHGDISICDTVIEAETEIESIDVENDEYEAFDARGNRLNLEVVLKRMGPKWLKWLPFPYVNLVKIMPSNKGNSDADELKMKLREFLKSTGHKIEGNESLELLIGRVRRG